MGRSTRPGRRPWCRPGQVESRHNVDQGRQRLDQTDMQASKHFRYLRARLLLLVRCYAQHSNARFWHASARFMLSLTLPRAAVRPDCASDSSADSSYTGLPVSVFPYMGLACDHGAPSVIVFAWRNMCNVLSFVSGSAQSREQCSIQPASRPAHMCALPRMRFLVTALCHTSCALRMCSAAHERSSSVTDAVLLVRVTHIAGVPSHLSHLLHTMRAKSE